jgi:hypothetical protein
MTTNRDFDRTVRAWLDLMSDEAPDRIVSAVLQAAETTPQVRSRAGRAFWRFPPMNRVSLAFAAAATLVVVIAGAAIFFKPPANVGVPASPSPSASSSSTEAVTGPVPSELQARWMGGHSDLVQAGAGSSVNLDRASLTVSQSNSMTTVKLSAAAAAVGPAQLRLEATNVLGGCRLGDVGVYSWTLSQTGRVLTLAADRDDCAARQGAVEGSWWLMGCRDSGTGCLGDLDAGTYKSQYIRPLLAPGARWQPKFGGVTYTVPDGWANWTDWPGELGLTTSTDFAATTPGNLEPSALIVVLTNVAAESQATPCSGVTETGVATTPGAVASWLQSVDGLDASTSTPITIDGHPGVYLDLTMDPSRAPQCGSEQATEYLTSDKEPWAVLPGERHRLTLLDGGHANLIAILVSTSDGATFDSFVASAMPIIESLHFE